MIDFRKNKIIKTISKDFPYPSIIKLNKFVFVPYKNIEISRKNIIKRDSYQCQYCGIKSLELTIDHVIPKSRGGSYTWDNLVACCHKCNNKKSSKTPEEVGLKLMSIPKTPNHLFFLRLNIGVPEESWKTYLFM
ncbi:MAG: HNH endonuclease [Candidatus Kapabacteria bacterium]|nr:HNH endonuclease [Candidatus Kapabacteria bacterium]